MASALDSLAQVAVSAAGTGDVMDEIDAVVNGQDDDSRADEALVEGGEETDLFASVISMQGMSVSSSDY